MMDSLGPGWERGSVASTFEKSQAPRVCKNFLHENRGDS